MSLVVETGGHAGGFWRVEGGDESKATSLQGRMKVCRRRLAPYEHS